MIRHKPQHVATGPTTLVASIAEELIAGFSTSAMKASSLLRILVRRTLTEPAPVPTENGVKKVEVQSEGERIGHRPRFTVALS